MWEGYLGEIRITAFSFAPRGWVFCHGQLLSVREHPALFAALGTRYGGDGVNTFALPDFRGRVALGGGTDRNAREWRQGQQGGQTTVRLETQHLPAHTHRLMAVPYEARSNPLRPPELYVLAQPLQNTYGPAENLVPMHPNAMALTGSDAAHANMQPFLALSFIICVNGLNPAVPVTGSLWSQPAVGEIRPFAGLRRTRHWVFCHGQILEINSQNQYLFDLLGNAFGGDGVTTFALPDLRGRVPIGSGQGPGLPNYRFGEAGGSEAVQITEREMPSHKHRLMGSANPATQTHPNDAVPAQTAAGTGFYSVPPVRSAARFRPQAVARTGGKQPHNNLMPSMGIHYIMATAGDLPVRA